MNAAQKRIVARFRRLVADAKKADLVLAVDAGAWALRFIPREVERASDDLREVGEAVEFSDERCDLSKGEAVGVDSVCGTPSGGNCAVM